MIDDNKLINFRRLVFEDAEKQRDDTMNLVEEEKKRRIKDIKDEVKEKYERRYAREVAKLKSGINEEISEKRNGQKRELLSAREELKNSVFVSVEEKLADYIKTEKYKEYIKTQIEKALSLLNCDDAVIIINENDEALKSLGYNTKTTDEDFKGGCIVVDRAGGHRIDLTMKSKLLKLKSEFLQTYKLKL